MEKFDYIVVGAGSAGCVVARRLSDDPSIRVLVLEAGPKADSFWIRTPAGMAKLFKDERYNWGYFTEPVPTLNNRSLYWPRGKALGGSSAINGMMYVRGHRLDFEHWASLGNEGWAWDDVLPYFKLSERNDRGDERIRGRHGLLTVTAPAVMHPTAVDFIAAAGHLGIPQSEQIDGVEDQSVGFLQATIKDGIRQSAYDAFLAPVKDRANLVIEANAHVHRVTFNGQKATGVEVFQGGHVRSFAAMREVILCGGAFNSPHLLMLSGVGDGKKLQSLGIKTIAHLPGVGKNLQDHFVSRVQAKTTNSSSYNSALHGWRKYWHGLNYLATRRGYLALGSSMAAAFVKSDPDIGYADLEISFRPMTFRHLSSGEVKVDDYPAIGASVYNMRPASRGEVLIKSPDPMQSPLFVANYLSHPHDVAVMLAGLRKVREIFAREPLASRIVAEIVPGPQALTDHQLLEFMRREGHCAFHPAGTCKMGNDDSSVVDARLRVRGVEALRVVDASIMPTVTSGNTNAACIMIGEKGADMIRSDL